MIITKVGRYNSGIALEVGSRSFWPYEEVFNAFRPKDYPLLRSSDGFWSSQYSLTGQLGLGLAPSYAGSFDRFRMLEFRRAFDVPRLGEMG